MAIENKDVTTEEDSQSEWFISETVDKYGPPTIAILSTALTWMTIQAPFYSGSLSGIETSLGKTFAFVGLLTIIGIAIREDDWRGMTHIIGGCLLSIIALIQHLQNYNVEMQVGVYSESIMIGVASGFGLWLALATGIATVYIGIRKIREET